MRRRAQTGLGRSTPLVVAVVIAAGCGLAACGSGKSAASRTAATCSLTRTSAASAATAANGGAWPYANGDLANTRDARDSPISSSNVSRLIEAWTFKLSGSAATGLAGAGSLTSAPIVRDGVVYVQDLDSDVYAIALASGKLRWEYRCDQPEQSGPGPNGVAVAGRTVYGLTPTTAFALNAATGRTVWIRRDLLSSGQGTFGIQPQVASGRLYLASQHGPGPGGGVLLALNASTGAELWRFNTVTGEDQGVRSIGIGSGGAWETPLVGRDGTVTYGIGNPYQSAAAAMAHPSAQLYTDSDVNLDAATGKLRWYYQGVTNDFEDHDMQASPISARVNGAAVVIGSGKLGYVDEMNADTGRLMWKTPVGEHNGRDNASRLLLEHKLTIKAPYTILPGSVGGVLTNLAVAGHTVYLATIDFRMTYTTLKLPVAVKSAGPATGQVEALNLATGKVRWDTRVAQMPVGAATVANNLVFTTLYDGDLVALNRATGAVVYRRRLPTSSNAPIAIAGDTVIVPAGGPRTSGGGGGDPQVVAYTVP
jgi:outer membrane protein assembly factor BamB